MSRLEQPIAPAICDVKAAQAQPHMLEIQAACNSIGIELPEFIRCLFSGSDQLPQLTAAVRKGIDRMSAAFGRVEKILSPNGQSTTREKQ